MQATQTRPTSHSVPHVDTPTESAVARTAEKVGQGDLVALGEKLAQGAAAGAEQFLGHLIWYSLAETRITREELLEALEDAGVDESFAPKKISPRDAFRRATASMEVVKVPITLSAQNNLIDDPNHAATGVANVMVRDVSSSSEAIVRQVVREEVDSNNVRLSYEPVAQIQMNKEDELSAFALAGKERELLPAERKLLRDVWSRFDYELGHYDSAAIRRIISEIKKDGAPVSMKASGGVYFISREHESVTDSIVRLIEELKDHSTTSKSSMVMAVPLVDADEYRDALAESLDEQVERQSKSLIHEMSGILKSDSRITDKRQKEFVDRVRELSATVGEYEQLLEREVEGARANLDLAHKEAMSLLSKVEIK
ncbi:MAG: hypothetical protein L0G70_10005 [Rubrobacter sp.]|nr:hypothetical protein [Rubrobacter sp.]